MTSNAQLELRVVEARLLNPLIRLLRLRAPDGSGLPGFSAGAHVRVRVQLADGSADWRHYSLIDPAGGGHAGPVEYCIAVRLESEGRGGSRYMHEALQVGDTLTIESPKNDFPIGDHEAAAVLIAGGIGVTPLVSMAARRKSSGQAVRMHYAARSRELMAFAPELSGLLGDDLNLHFDAEAGAPLDVDAVLDACGPHDQLYVCGPKVMLDAVLACAKARDWAPERVHFELFTTPVAEAGDRAFEVVLAQSGQSYAVPCGQTILDCLIEHGCDPMFDCKRGECGVCSTAVVEGDIDHRDYFLSQAEKDSGKVIQICVSRARSARLVLDL